MNPCNLENIYNEKLCISDEQYTNAVDSGSYSNFIYDKAGYGLVQWTWWSRKKALYDYAKSLGTSIGDLDMQLNFLWKELNNGYIGVLETLRNATSVLEASNEVLFKFERPANQDASVQEMRARYGRAYYDKYANT